MAVDVTSKVRDYGYDRRDDAGRCAGWSDSRTLRDPPKLPEIERRKRDTTAMNEAAGFDLVWQLATVYFVPCFAILLSLVAINYWIKGQWVTALTFVGFGAVLAAGEGASVYFTGKT